ncbi:hypothetical protein Asulf_01229 [Archaeoglobus sulfaticallidus PM70-1]|uniref:Transcription factor Pcc1 n=1 Tax=Archaeoglobus sulfaticallidus PM70-1 TaxID=387631 RepID=N0BLU5_9EURY|nr:KEOPS complex subunit Pcc1 [Archaeoglobus sulfaticallidus]AGK61225.1 hypothetical protein Asulf_01229 [Archaeoglobus sulfaticallidus PM70-1]
MLFCDGEVRIKHNFAEIISRALKPDDTQWNETTFEGDEIILRVKTPKIGSMMNAFDDYFLNLKAAFSVLKSLER